MISIIEEKTKKVAGETSLFFSSTYNTQYVEILKTFSGSTYHQKEKIWEIPITYLSKLIDEFTIYDDIELKLLKDKQPKHLTEDIIKLSNYKTKLLEYQKEGVKYGLRHDKFMLLDEPGLGKTVTSLYIALELKKRKKIKHCLIICGINALKENWRKEIEKHTDLSCKILGEKVSKTGKRHVEGTKERLAQLKNKIDEFFVITNIESLREDKIVKEINSGKNQFDLIIFDEAHCAKSPQAIQTKGLLKLNKAPYKIALTGTLLLNNPLDAYVALKWLGIERSTYTNFKYYYCTFSGPFHNIIVGFKNVKVLKNIIEKYSLRRTKKEVLKDLPPKIVINEYVDMDSAQEIFYENIKAGIRDQVDKVRLTTSNLLALTARLRQATACPSILTTENIPSAKLDRACSLIEEIVENGNKVLIFSTFKQSVYELEKRLAKFNPVVATGDYKDEVISKAVDDFQNDPERKVFICTWQKCGTGLTLTAATYEIFIDVPWTDGVYTQAQDRCHRIGTKDNITIYHLITSNTIDERVLEIVEDKSAIASYIIDDQITDKGINSLRKYIEDL